VWIVSGRLTTTHELLVGALCERGVRAELVERRIWPIWHGTAASSSGRLGVRSTLDGASRDLGTTPG
jgi:hypothetical protein